MSNPERNPERIGPYKILDVLGEGGMGTVYLAEQREPVRRRVALKVIKLGMDSSQVLARFELERRALSAMSHSSIAKMFEAGATERGQPYFVMELVSGLPLTDYCDKHRSSISERIALFQQVCRGVQHAHQKGVIHRDLKPANILVERTNDESVPKIVDFGLAKATNTALMARTIYTEREQIVGTPEYMAPEQAALDEEGVDTRADIYSLGVVLYELLSGELPFSPTDLRTAGWLEIRRKLIEEDPQRPSTRLTTDPSSEQRAARRGMSGGGLRKRLHGELDWIVLKALAKEPERRYASAAALASDLQRHLDHEPVEAGPPSATYRLQKLVRRYRVQFVATTLVLLVLVAGVIASMLFAFDANEQRRTVASQKTAIADNLKTSRANGLAKAAQDEVRSEPTRALLLALEAIAIERNIETISALHRALALCHERRVYGGASSRISVVDVAPDENRFIAGTPHGQIRLWRRGTTDPQWERKLSEKTNAYDDDIKFAKFLGEGDRIVVANHRGEVRLYNENGDELASHTTEIGRVRVGALAPNGVQFALGGDEGTQLLALTQPDGIAAVGDSLRADGPVQVLAFDRSSQRLAIGEANGLGRLWELREGEDPVFAGHLLDEPREVRSMEFSANGDVLLVGAAGGRTVVVDLKKRPPVPRVVTKGAQGSYVGFLKPRHASAFGRDHVAQFVAVAGGAGWFYIFDTQGTLIAGPSYLSGLVRPGALSFPPSRDRFAIGGLDGVVHVRGTGAHVVATLIGHLSTAVGMRFTDDANGLLTWGFDGTVREWTIDDPTLVWRPTGIPTDPGRQGHDVWLLRRAPGDTQILTASRGTTDLWNAELDRVQSFPSAVAVDFDKARNRAVLLSRGKLQLRDIRTGWPVGESSQSNVIAFCLLPPRREQLLYYSSGAGHGSVVNLSASDPFARIALGPRIDDAVRDVFPSSDGQSVVLIDGGFRAYLSRRSGDIWSPARRMDVIHASTAGFAQDGSLLIGTQQGAIFGFDAIGRRLHDDRFVGHAKAIRALVFSDDSKLVASASEDGTARLWNREGQLQAVLEGPAGAVFGCMFTPDGQQVWTGHHDGTVRRWFVDPEELIRQARVRTSRALSDVERQRFRRFLPTPSANEQQADSAK